MKAAFAIMVAGVLSLSFAGTAGAHHNFAAEFDENNKIELTGVVTKINWRNPHAYFFIDVAGTDGSVHNWGLELGSPNGLMRQGWTRTSLNIGDTVTVSGFRARDNSFKGNARSVVLSNGQRLFSQSNQTSGGSVYFKKDEKETEGYSN